MKVLKGLYVILWMIMFIIIGLGVGEFLLKIYHNYGEILLAKIFVCFISGAITSFLPGWILIEDWELNSRDTSTWIVAFFWIIGTVAPIIFGIENLLQIIVSLMIVPWLIIGSIIKSDLLKNIKNNKNNN